MFLYFYFTKQSTWNFCNSSIISTTTDNIINNLYLFQTLINHVPDRILTEEEVGQRLLTALKGVSNYF